MKAVLIKRFALLNVNEPGAQQRILIGRKGERPSDVKRANNFFGRNIVNDTMARSNDDRIAVRRTAPPAQVCPADHAPFAALRFTGRGEDTPASTVQIKVASKPTKPAIIVEFIIVYLYPARV